MIKIEEFLNESKRLPSIPAIALKILEAVRSDENSFLEITEIIKADPVLTARTLKLANASLYGNSGRIHSLAHAVSLIGTHALKNIALSFVIIDSIKNPPQGSFDLDYFWRRAITAAVAADTLAKEIGMDAQDIFISSLLQDFGVLILFLSYGAQYTEIFDQKRISGKELQAVEKEKMGFNHAELGAHFLRTWHLPESIHEPIGNHHVTEDFETPINTAYIVNIAGKIASIYHGRQSSSRLTEIHNHLHEHRRIFTKEQISELLDKIGTQSIEIIDSFSIPPGEMKPFSQMIQQANDELQRLNYSYEQIVIELTQAKQNADQLIIELKQANDKLKELTVRDSLTNLYNHGYFVEVLATEIQKSVRYQHNLSMLLIDIDFFKHINDTFGHPVGDQVLIEISNLLLKLVRNCDIVARYGGEEFGVVLPATDITGASVLANRLRRGVEQHAFTHEKCEISMTVSIGVASVDVNNQSISSESFITHCDHALYAAKRKGRNRIERWGDTRMFDAADGQKKSNGTRSELMT